MRKKVNFKSNKKFIVPKSSLPTTKHRKDPRRVIRKKSILDNDQSQYIYGKNSLIELLRQDPKRIQKIYVSKIVISDDKRVDLIFKLIKENELLFQKVPSQKLNSLVDMEMRHKAEFVHQGFVAVVTAKPLLSLDEWLLSVKEKVAEEEKGVVIVLDEITDPHNIGAIIRVAESMGVLGMIVPKHKSGIISPVVSKVSSGADRYLPVVQVGNLNQALQSLKKEGFWILGSDVSEESRAFYEYDYKKMPTVLVMGSEGKGIRDSIKSSCDMLGHIPMFGKTESLNVSTATAIMLYEITLQQNREE